MSRVEPAQLVANQGLASLPSQLPSSLGWESLKSQSELSFHGKVERWAVEGPLQALGSFLSLRMRSREPPLLTRATEKLTSTEWQQA